VSEAKAQIMEYMYVAGLDIKIIEHLGNCRKKQANAFEKV